MTQNYFFHILENKWKLSFFLNTEKMTYNYYKLSIIIGFLVNTGD